MSGSRMDLSACICIPLCSKVHRSRIESCLALSVCIVKRLKRRVRQRCAFEHHRVLPEELQQVRSKSIPSDLQLRHAILDPPYHVLDAVDSEEIPHSLLDWSACVNASIQCPAHGSFIHSLSHSLSGLASVICPAVQERRLLRSGHPSIPSLY